MVMNRSRALGLLLAALAASCGDTPTTPTSTAPVSPLTESFSSQLSVKGTSSRSFVTPSRGSVSVTLSATFPSGTVVGLGVGIPRANGSGCLLSTSVQTGAAASPQIVIDADKGEYCVQVYDLGTLTDAISFTIAIVHP